MTDAKTILDAGERLAGPTVLDNGATLVIHRSDEIVSSLESYLDHPTRARAKVAVEDTASFITYFNRFKNGESLVFARLGLAGSRVFSILGALDYHKPNAEAAHREHTVSYTPPVSEQWARWKSMNGKRMTQTDFALFIEENSLDVVAPKAADMIEMSRSLKAKKAVEFVSDQRLADGSIQFTYNEDIKGTAGKGNMKVPDKFTIGVPIFFNGPAYKVDAHLRYRIEEGKLQVWYDLHRADYAEQSAFNEIVEKVEFETKAPLFRGAA